MSGPAREMLRVKHGTYFVADCRTVAEVAELVDLATLVPSNGPVTRVFMTASRSRRSL